MGFRVHTHRGADHARPAGYIMKLQIAYNLTFPPPHTMFERDRAADLFIYPAVFF